MARVTRRTSDKKNRAAIETNGGRALTAVAAPVPLEKGEFVRMKHPTLPGTYYSKETAAWVTEGWTVWTDAEWRGTFGKDPNDLRQWEHFGYRIPLYNDEDEQPR